MENISITAKNQQHAEKIKEGQKYIPYKLLEQIVIETNINKKLIEEINSELQRIHFQGNNPNVNNTSNMSNANINPHRFESSNINVLNNRNE